MRPEALSLPTRGSRLVGLLFSPMTTRFASPEPPPLPFFFSPPPHAASITAVHAAATMTNWRIFIVLLLGRGRYKRSAEYHPALCSAEEPSLPRCSSPPPRRTPSRR